jgi:hypothetical protein
MESELYLKVLRSRFVIRGDRRWTDFLAQLWEPFCSRPGLGAATVIDVSKEDRAWTVHFGDDTVFGGTDPWALSNNVRYLILQQAQSDDSPYLFLHAAVVAREENAVVLAGPSGAGKTTLALALVDRGWSLVSDDLAVLDPASGSLLSFLKPVSIKDAGAFRHYESRWAVPEWIGAPHRGFLAPAALFSPSKRSRHRANAVTFLERRRNGPTTLNSFSGARATALLSRHIGGVDAGSLGAVARLCSSATCLTLTHGNVSAAAGQLHAVALHPLNWYKPA